MTTPAGTISMSDVNVELSKASSALISLNDFDVRSLAAKPSGTISMDDLRGKSAVNYGTLTPNFTARSEGQSFIFTLSGGTAVPDGTYYWRVDYVSNLESADFSASSGSFTVTSNAGSFTVTTVNDALDEGDGTFRVVLGNAPGVPEVFVASQTVTVTETVTYTAGVITNANPYRLGTITDRLVAFEVQTTNLPTGTTLYWNLLNVTGTVTTTDLSNISGSVTTAADGTAAISVFVNEVDDGSAVASKAFRFRIYKDAARTDLALTSSTITIRAAPTYSVSFSPATIAEGQATTMSVTTTNYPSGTSIFYTATGAVSDLLGVASSGSISLSSGAATSTLWAAYDGATEANETVTVNLRTKSTVGAIVDTATFTISNALGTVTTLTLARTGGATPGSAVTITLRIASIPAYGAARTFSIQYSFNGGAWTTAGLDATSITVNANATSSSAVTIYTTPGATYADSLKVRVSLTGHTTKESNTISGFYI